MAARSALLLAVAFLLPVIVCSMTERGLIYLDELTYKKIIDGSRDVLLRFERDYVIGDEHEEFKQVAERIGESAQPMLVATIPVAKRDFNPKNVDVAVRYNADDDKKWPTFVLFKKGVNWRGTPIRYDDHAPKKAKNLLSWFAHHTDAFVGLKGQIKSLHNLAHAMVVAGNDAETRQMIVVRAEKAAGEVQEEELQEAAKYYLKVFQKTATDPFFPATETKRLSGLLSGQMSDDKRNALAVKLNVLASFGSYSAKRSPRTEF